MSDIAHTLIDFSDIKQSGIYYKVANFPFAPVGQICELTFLKSAYGPPYYDQVTYEGVGYLRYPESSEWHKLWDKKDDVMHKPPFTEEQERRIKEIIVETLGCSGDIRIGFDERHIKQNPSYIIRNCDKEIPI